MPMTNRLYADRRAAGMSVLTLLGALASPIFYPVAGWLLEGWGWRTALRVLVLLMLLCIALAAALVRTRPVSITPPSHSTLQALRMAAGESGVRRALLLLGLGSMASSALLLHQVAVLGGAGLSLSVASTVAGARGAFQIPGRLLLAPLISRFGVRRSMGICYAFAATSALALFVAVGEIATVPLAVYFAVASGMALGLLSPLNGLFQADVFGDERLGTLSGATVICTSVAAALGGWLAGVAFEVSGSYRYPLAGVVALHGLSIVVLSWQAHARSTAAAPATVAGGPGV